MSVFVNGVKYTEKKFVKEIHRIKNIGLWIGM